VPGPGGTNGGTTYTCFIVNGQSASKYDAVNLTLGANPANVIQTQTGDLLAAPPGDAWRIAFCPAGSANGDAIQPWTCSDNSGGGPGRTNQPGAASFGSIGGVPAPSSIADRQTTTFTVAGTGQGAAVSGGAAPGGSATRESTTRTLTITAATRKGAKAVFPGAESGLDGKPVVVQRRKGGPWLPVGRGTIGAGRWSVTVRGAKPGAYRAVAGSTTSGAVRA